MKTRRFSQALSLVLLLGIVITNPLFASAYTKPSYFSNSNNNTSFFDDDYDQNEKNIWIHTHNTEDLLAALGFIFKLKKRFPYTECFVSSLTFEAKKVADQFFNPYCTKVIPHDDLDTISYNFRKIRPKVILPIGNTVLPSLVLLGLLYKTPIYLFGGKVAQQIERVLYTSNYLYNPVFNALNGIYTDTEDDLEAFRNVGIIEPHIIPIGPLYLCNIFEKKRYYTDSINQQIQLANTLKQYQILLVHTRKRTRIQDYLDLFKQLKSTNTALKMVFVPGRAVSLKSEINKLIAQQDFSIALLENETDFNIHPTQIEKTLSNINGLLQCNDIVFSCAESSSFFWQAFATMSFVDDQDSLRQIHESAVWKNAVIMYQTKNSEFRSEEITDNLFALLATTFSVQELVNQTQELLSNQEIRTSLGQKLFNFVSEQTQKTDQILEPFFYHLQQKLTF
ncbi:hypothetical protein K2X40_03095 [Candidatus Babeliales bacterium]|nr:hypothetical protein [Candidatus Babeliales bacterium]